MERDEKLNVWIRGNEDNPKGVIKTLEKLGGKDFWGEGSNSKCMYFINDIGNIDCYYINTVVAHCIMNTFKEIQPVEMDLPNDKKLVWCWRDDNEGFGKDLRFYDAMNETTFSLDGERFGCEYDNYELYEGEWPEWAKNLLSQLED